MLFILILISFAPLLNVDGRPSSEDNFNYPLACLVRQFTTNLTMTDENGKKCRGIITTKICSGSCESYEYATNERRVIVNPTCNYNESRELTAIFTDCDEGVHPSAKVIKYIEAVSCSCLRCNPQKQRCRSITNRDSIRNIIISEQQQFDNDRQNALSATRSHSRRHERRRVLRNRRKVYRQ